MGKQTRVKLNFTSSSTSLRLALQMPALTLATVVWILTHYYFF